MKPTGTRTQKEARYGTASIVQSHSICEWDETSLSLHGYAGRACTDTVVSCALFPALVSMGRSHWVIRLPGKVRPFHSTAGAQTTGRCLLVCVPESPHAAAQTLSGHNRQTDSGLSGTDCMRSPRGCVGCHL